MMKKIKSYYNKDNTDFSTGYIDPFEFHQIFYQVLVAFKVADLENKNPPSYFNQNVILFVTGLIATVFAFTSFFHDLETQDVPHITEAGTYTIVLSYKLLILSCTRKNIPQYHNLLRALKEDFHLYGGGEIPVKSVCDACWNIPFWNAGPVIRPYMVLIMQRSLRPLPLQAPEFKDISLETFSKKMTSAYSLFNMLRQTNH